MIRLAATALIGSALLIGSCSQRDATGPLPAPGGVWTIAWGATSHTLVQPTPTMDRETELRFWTGFAMFRDPWVKAPSSTTARDGLGPLFSARSCQSCHAGAGRGDSLLNDPDTPAMAFKLADVDDIHSRFGDQLQTRAIYDVTGVGKRLSGFYPGEPRPSVKVETLELDDTDIVLNRVHASVPDIPAYAISPRVAPGLVGLGLLEAIPLSRLEALEDPNDANSDGITGRVHWVGEGATRVAGRFGWKAPHPTVAAQTADAFRNDIGITSVYNPVETCAPQQQRCHDQRSGNGPQGDHEIGGILFDTAVEFTASLAVPEARRATAKVWRGQRVFEDLACAACHTPSHDIVVADKQTTIWPYTDLLLHDMGPLLADGIAQGDATGGEWRTPPLWSLGLQQQLNPETGFLHDGRAATIQEAVLWHGGEAATAAARFKALSKAEQDALAAFVLAL